MEFKHGRAVHALCAAVKTFIRDYIQGIADLAAAPNLPLPMLLLKLQQPVEMLRTAATIVGQVSDLRGAPITSALNTAAKDGKVRERKV